MSSTKRSSSSSKGGPTAAEREAAAKAKEEAARAKEELVKAMTDPAKSDLLAQALLREYMHRKGFKKTLASFDKENPRTEATINSREFMNSLLSTQFIQKRNAARKEPFPTIMEMLCSYRLRKRELRGTRPESVTYALVGPEGTTFDSSDEEKELADVLAKHKAAVTERITANKAAEEAHAAAVQAAAEAAAVSEKKKEKKKKSSTAEGGEDGEGESPKAKKKKKDKEKDGKAKKNKESPSGSLSSFPTTSSSGTFGRAFDPLGLAGGGPAGLGIGKSKLSSGSGNFDPLGFSSDDTNNNNSSSSFASGSGSTRPLSSGGLNARGKWTPGGNTHIPSVGISSTNSALLLSKKQKSVDGNDDSIEDYKPPSFIAGNGFTLSTGTAKVSAAGATDVWEGAGEGGKLRWGGANSGLGLSPNTRLGSSPSLDRDDIPSPYANLGQVKFDANAKAKSVLSNKNTFGLGNNNNNITQTANTNHNTAGSSLSSPFVSSGGARTGKRITWGGEASPSEPSSEVSSPVSAQPAGMKTGFYFNTSPGSPAGSGRQRQSRVKIIEGTH